MKLKAILATAALGAVIGGSAHAGCLSITTPAPGQNEIRGSVINIGFHDTCPNRWFECFLVNGTTLQCATPTPQDFFWTTSAYYPDGPVTIEVTSWTKNAGRKLGDVLESINLVDAP